MSIRDYSRYALSDFLEDDHFIRWVIAPDAHDDAFWLTYIKENPGQEEAIHQASSIIRVYRLQTSFSNDEGKAEVWDRIDNTLREQRPVRRISPFYNTFYKVAAAVTLLVASAAVLWFTLYRDNVIQTAYGEVRTITLPDQSRVTLNGNSTLRYARRWHAGTAREVWLEGEAYFDVVHLNRDTANITPGQRFVVHSAAVNLEVLGTTFNVEQRCDQTNITLISGKVRVDVAHESSASRILAPGDHLEYVKTKLVEHKRMQKLNTVTAWMSHSFAYSNPQLADIVRSLQNDYGYKVEADDTLLQLRIEGEISVSGIPELLSTVEVTLGLRIEKSDQRIVILRR